MAAFSHSTLLRTCSTCKLFPSVVNAAKAVMSKPRSGSNFEIFNLTRNYHNSVNSKISLCRLLSTRHQLWRHQSTSSSTGQNELDQNDLIKDFEVSHEEFKYVEQVLPSSTVPELNEDAQYPTPSGWFPPNESLQAQQKYIVRRTRNHMLPVYSHKEEKWYGVAHYVSIRKIEGDIWALEADLREHILNSTGNKSVNTQVHEVGRFIRVRGQHRDLIANFLLGKGN